VDLTTNKFILNAFALLATLTVTPSATRAWIDPAAVRQQQTAEQLCADAPSSSRHLFRKQHISIKICMLFAVYVMQVSIRACKINNSSNSQLL
jgi:hypothetical protein